MQEVAGLPKAIESFYSCSTTLHTQARLTFKQTSLAYLFIRLQHAGDYIWGAQMWFCSASDEANASERLRCETLKAKPPLEEFVRHPEIYVTPRKEIQWCARLRPR